SLTTFKGNIRVRYAGRQGNLESRTSAGVIDNAVPTTQGTVVDGGRQRSTEKTKFVTDMDVSSGGFSRSGTGDRLEVFHRPSYIERINNRDVIDTNRRASLIH